jgi:signal peptidase II
MGNIRTTMLGLLLGAIAFFFDQLSKAMVLTMIAPLDQPSVTVLPFFNLVLVWNYGISFGMFAGHRQPLILTAMSLVIVAVLLVWMWRNSSTLVSCALGLVMGGAIGNVVDRLRFDAVADFLDFHVAGWHWPAFNIADSCIFIGVVLLCISSMVAPRHNETGGSTS